MSEILVNKLTGTSTAGSILVTGEGNSTTTNLQQGLAKAWVNFNGSGTVSIRDSINIASITDSGTGTFSMNMSNAMGNDDYTTSGCAFYSGAAGFDDTAVISRDNTQLSSLSTTVNPFFTYRLSSAVAIKDCFENMLLLHGDLA